MTRGYTGTMAGAYTNGRAFYVIDDYGNVVVANDQWADWETVNRFNDAMDEVWR